MRKIFTDLVYLLLLASVCECTVGQVLADKIVGIVGDKIVLKSDISNYIDDIKRQGGEVPPDAECILLERMMMDKALVLQAEKDSLPVSEEEIEAELDQRIRYFIMEYGGKEAVEQIAGRTSLPDQGRLQGSRFAREDWPMPCEARSLTISRSLLLK